MRFRHERSIDGRRIEGDGCSSQARARRERGTTRTGGAVEYPRVRIHGQSGAGLGAGRSEGEAVERGERAGGGDLKNRAVVGRAAKFGRAIKVPVQSLNQRRHGIISRLGKREDGGGRVRRRELEDRSREPGASIRAGGVIIPVRAFHHSLNPDTSHR